MNSPYGEEFRQLLNVWDKQRLIEAIDNQKTRIKAIIDGGPMILFMKHKDSGSVYGCDEPGRVMFARMKEPDEDSPPEWADEASFMATNLSKMLGGEDGAETVFGKKDLKKLDVLDDKDKLIDMLLGGMKGETEGEKKKMFVLKIGTRGPEEDS